MQPYRERRVTFSTVDFKDESNVQYYDTVANGDQESISDHVVIESEPPEAESSSQISNPEDTQNMDSSLSHRHSMEFEHIPDQDELEKISLSSRSDSSLSEKVFKEDQRIQGNHSTTTSFQLTEECIQQQADFSTSRKVEVPHISREGEIPGFSSESLTDCPPHTNNRTPVDPDYLQENEELFDFSDSVRSTSARSSGVFGSFNDGKIVAPTFNKQMVDMSSSSSYISDDEPTEYTVNFDQESELQIHSANPKRPTVTPDRSYASDSSDSDENARVKVTFRPRKKPTLNFAVVGPSVSQDPRAPSLPAKYSSSSSNESEAVITDVNVEYSKSHYPNARFPVVDLQHIPRIKRCLDIKATFPVPESSSSSDSEDDTTGQLNKHGYQEVYISRPQTEVCNPDTQWPAVDLQHVPRIKRRLDIKAPLPASDSSFSSDSEDETTDHINKHVYQENQMSKLSGEVSKTKSHDPDARWPAVDLQHVPRIKRRLDIKAPSPASDSSFSSDSEYETTGHINKHEHLGIHILRPQTESPHSETQWPAVDLQHVPRLKRRLDIKGPSPASDSSFSSYSEYETTGHINKHEHLDLHISRPQTGGYNPETQWPAVDLQHVPHIKRRLDIKGPSAAPDFSSSSDSEDDTTGHINKHEHLDIHISRPQTEGPLPETQWPAVDLQHVPRIKRRLDIKGPSAAPDFSYSSDSEDDTTGHINKHEHLDINISKPRTEGPCPETQWPAVDLQHVPHIKRRLDVKASIPISYSSSSSDNEDETTDQINKHVYEDIHMPRHPSEEFLTKSHDPDARWPTLDLQYVPHIKRRLDIKAPSPAPDSSCSGDSEDDTTGHINKHEHWDVHISKPQTEVPCPETQWPAVDLQHVPRLKRRLDIKAPSPVSNAFSSSDSENETTGYINKHEHWDVHISRPQTEGYNPETQWPAVDLQHVPHIKRRLDIKGPSPDPDSSSSSDSVDDTTGHINKHEHLDVHISRPQTEGPLPETQWPAVDLQHVPHIKRRLDVKASIPVSDSSSSSDSEDQTIDQITKHVYEDIHMPRHPSEEFLTKSHDPDARWPTVDLQYVPHIKRRLDIKAPSPANDSSCSSDSEDDTTGHINKHEHWDVHISKPQTEVPCPETQWPAVDLQHVPRLKRRLDIKAPSPVSNAFSSSDSENETTDHINKHEHWDVHISRPQTEGYNPETQWPAVDLQHVPRLKRRLDIKAPSPVSNAFSSSDSENETTGHINKHEHWDVHISRPQTEGYNPETQWPAVDLQHVPHIKRRLDVKASIPVSDSSSSSDSEDQTTDQINKHVYKDIHMPRHPSEEFLTKNHDPDARWPTVDLQYVPHIKRRLDIKAPSPAPDSSSRPHTEDNNQTQWPDADLSSVSQVKRWLDIKVKSPPNDPLIYGSSESHTPEGREFHKNRPLYSSESSDEQEEEMKDLRKPSLKTESQPDSSWPEVSLSNIPHVKRHLDIQALSPQQDKQPQVGMGESFTSKTSANQVLRSPELNISQSPKTDNIKLEKYTLISEDSNDNPYTSPEINPELQSRWATMNLGISRFRKRLEITHQPPNLPSSPPPDSPSYEGNSSRTRRKRMDFGMQEITDSFLILQNNPGEVSPTVKDQHYNISGSLEAVTTTDEKQKPDAVFSFSGPAPLQQQHDSSTRNSEDTVDHKLPDLSLGVPRIKRRLNIKAPSPEPSSSFSDSESENQVEVYTEKESTKESNMLGMTEDESLIAYKRLIIKASPPPGNSFYPGVRSQTIDYSKQRYTVAQEGEGYKGASPTPRRVQSLNVDGIVGRKLVQSRHHTDLDLPPELRWTGTGLRLSDLSISTPRSQNSTPTSPPAESELSLPDSLNSNTDSREPYGTLLDKYPYHSANSVTPTSTDSLDKLDHLSSSTYEPSRTVSEERREQRGLSALKAMSSERRKWDTETETGSPLLDDHQSVISFNYHRSDVNNIPLSKQPLTGLRLASASINEKRDLSYGIPNYRRHYVGDLEPPQAAPPPIPATPPPTYDTAGLTWRSPQSSEKQNTSSLPSANLESHFDYSNTITEV
ncbi:uncharacterized protein LOC114434676 [Parambassis ranga]|uniref:Uncharacterized protein LOC114434676 n=1 Tax=Parambassis ranga TaxID=210632 RepID=A0A6P7IAA2_9TELE|nr:uncharacterized protein LOC114434676 [Parambassis ranga]